MTLSAYQAGFDERLAEANYALINGENGQPYGAPAGPSHFAVTTLPGQVLTVSVAPGSVTGWGVRVTSDAAVTKTFGPAGAGTVRWDLVCLRRDWASNTVTIEVVPGTSVQALPNGRFADPGTKDDQPLALVQVTGGQTVPTAVIDLRVWPSKVHTANSLLAVPTGPGTVAVVAGVTYARENGLWVQQGVRRYSRESSINNIGATAVNVLISNTFNPGHQLRLAAHVFLQGFDGEVVTLKLLANGAEFQTARAQLNDVGGVTIDFSETHTPVTPTIYTLTATRTGGSHAASVNAAPAFPTTLTVETL